MKRKPTQRVESAQSHSEGERKTIDETKGKASWCPLVGIGASAGGIEMLIRLFGAMPADSGMAFLIVMHLDPTRESGLTQLLGQHSTMAVAEATDGMAIKPNHIYVIPPAVSLTWKTDIYG